MAEHIFEEPRRMRVRPLTEGRFAKQVDLEDLSALVAGLQDVLASMADRQAVYDRALTAVIEDVDDIAGALFSDQTTDGLSTNVEQESNGLANEPSDGEFVSTSTTDEPEEDEEAARRAAIAAFEAGNEGDSK